MAQLVLHVPDIDASGKDFRFELSTAWLGEALADAPVRPAGGAGSLQVHAQRSGADILVHGHIRTRVVAECVRCLGDAVVDVDADVTSLMTARGPELRPEPDEVELTPEDLEREFFSGTEIVLDSLVREHILLECPMQPLCAETCAGIDIPKHVRPPSEDEEPVDPRLAPLMKLAKQMKDPSQE
ncbi:MAG: YceD family protein [Myxococcota bacterium]